MHYFDDAKGRTWSIDISTIELAAIRKATDFRLTDIFDDEAKGYARLCTDWQLLVDCVWICCEEQAKANDVSMYDFIRSINGDVLIAAQEALSSATVAFFPHQEIRRGCQRVLNYARDKTKSELKIMEAMVEKALAEESTGKCGS